MDLFDQTLGIFKIISGKNPLEHALVDLKRDMEMRKCDIKYVLCITSNEKILAKLRKKSF